MKLPLVHSLACLGPSEWWPCPQAGQLHLQFDVHQLNESVSSSRSLMQILNNLGTATEPCRSACNQPAGRKPSIKHCLLSLMIQPRVSCITKPVYRLSYSFSRLFGCITLCLKELELVKRPYEESSEKGSFRSLARGRAQLPTGTVGCCSLQYLHYYLI